MLKPFFAALVALCLALPVQAADFPTRDLTVIVPFAPGGGVDVTVRMLGAVAPGYLNGKNLLVENLPGGGAVTGQTAAAKSKPDGTTLLAYTSSVVSNPIFKSTPFKYTDFTPVLMYCLDPEILVVPANSPFTTLKDFLTAAGKAPISMATPGHSTSHHIAALLTEKQFGLKFRYIHNSSATQQITQLLGGHVQSAMMTYGEVTSYLKDGSLRALGLMSDGRYSGAEDIERFSTLGFDTEWGAFRGLAVPAATPKELVVQLSETFGRMAADPAFVKQMQEEGFPLVVMDAEAFALYVKKHAAILEKIRPLLQGK